MKTCPYCAEKIQTQAIKCKHCMSDLSEGESKISSPQRITSKKQQTLEKIKNSLLACSGMSFKGGYDNELLFDYIEPNKIDWLIFVYLDLLFLPLGIIYFIIALVKKPHARTIQVTLENKQVFLDAHKKVLLFIRDILFNKQEALGVSIIKTERMQEAEDFQEQSRMLRIFLWFLWVTLMLAISWQYTRLPFFWFL